MSEYPRPENPKAWSPYRFDAYLGWPLALLFGGYCVFRVCGLWRDGQLSQGWSRYAGYYIFEWIFELAVLGLIILIARSSRIGMIVAAALFGLMVVVLLLQYYLRHQLVPIAGAYAAIWLYCLLRLTGVLRSKPVIV